jgi:hypothetical protein
VSIITFVEAATRSTLDDIEHSLALDVTPALCPISKRRDYFAGVKSRSTMWLPLLHGNCVAAAVGEDYFNWSSLYLISA